MHVRREQAVLVRHLLDVAHRGVALQRADAIEPAVRGRVCATSERSDVERVLDVADEREVDADVLVDLRRVELAVDLLRVDGDRSRGCR